MRLDALVPDFRTAKTATTWKEVKDRVAGQTPDAMPPKKKPQPTAEEVKTLREWIGTRLTAAAAVDAASQAAQGRAQMRRLNRVEHSNTLRDLLGISVDLKPLLPEDEAIAGFMGTHPIFNGNTIDYHNLSHHGKLPENLDKLSRLEDESMRAFAHLMTRLSETKEEGEPLLKRTMVLLGSNLGNSNTHETTNLPILLAGGGFKHGQHLAFHRENNTPLCNLYVSMLQRLGLEISSFGSSKGTLKGLEFAST